MHGDLSGSNVHWAEDGKLVGVLDWDNALPGDPALDAALMSWHRWDAVREAVPAEMYHRARTYDAVLGAEHLIACMNGRPMTSPDGFLQAVVPWLEAQENLA
nr:phosphotransferase [Lentzea guizhouensis]